MRRISSQSNGPASEAGRLLHLWLALSVWVLSVAGISVLVFRAPSKGTVTTVYHEVVNRWLTNQPIYPDGWMYSFYYFPQFVFAFIPFHFLPVPLGDILWRAVSTGLFAWGIWRVINLFGPDRSRLLFWCATIIAFAPSLGAMRNGQANLIFAAFTAHAAACLGRSAWGTASLCLLCALMIKPLGLVMVLLAALVYRPLLWRLIPGVLIFLSFPFLFAGTPYVLSQYLQSVERLFSSSLVTEHRFADLNGLLQTIGVDLRGGFSQFVRIMAGLVTAILWLIGAKRICEPRQQACLLLGLATTYLMLFNPMTEGNSYVIVAPVLAVYAVRFLLVEGRPILGWGLAFLCFSIGVLPEIVRGVDRNFGLWWPPVMMLMFGAFLTHMVFSGEPKAERPASLSTDSGGRTQCID